MIFRSKKDYLQANIRPTDVVLDVGFVGQGIRADQASSSHAVLRSLAGTVYGLDMQEYVPDGPVFPGQYKQGSAEDFAFPERFDVIYAGDLIEHLANPGKFLESSKRHLKPGGRLLLTTPNAFNLFNLAEKLTKPEPTVNPDHTMYLNRKTLKVLLEKAGFVLTDVAWVYSLGLSHRESFKKKGLNVLYWILARFTDKFMETLCVQAVPLSTETGPGRG